MEETKLTIYKILASGTWKSYMWVREFPSAIAIPRKLYYELKELGVPTSQRLRKKM